jgi:hypothetical protein
MVKRVLGEKQTASREMAVIGQKEAEPGWPGMRLEIETSEYKGTGEEPYFHLYKAKHRSGDRKDSSITRVALTETPPSKIEDLHPIKGNPPIPKSYLKPILDWSKGKKREVNNWVNALNMWDAIQASRPSN